MALRKLMSVANVFPHIPTYGHAHKDIHIIAQTHTYMRIHGYSSNTKNYLPG